MEFLRYGANALQGAAKKCAQIRTQPGTIQSGPLEGSVVVARHDPGFIRNSGRVGTQSEVVAASFNDALGLPFLLLDDVAKHTAFLADEILASGPQLVEHAPRDKHGGGDLRRGMAEFLSSALAVILKQADVLDARIALEVKNALGDNAKVVSDLFVSRSPQMAVVARVFNDHLMGAHRMHPVIDAVAATARLALDAVERLGMNDRTRRPGNSRSVGRFCNHLWRRRSINTETARGLG